MTTCGHIAVFLILHVLFKTAFCQEADKCDQKQKQLQNCSDIALSSRFDFNDLAIKKESIERTCKPIHEGVNCVDDFFNNCNTNGLDKSQFLNEGHKILLETCVMFEERYLPHYECYEKLDAGYIKCLDNIEKISQDIGTVNQANEQQKQELCCNIKKIFTCVHEPTEKDCGTAAADAIEEVLNKQFPPFLHTICETYKERCPDIKQEMSNNNIANNGEAPNNGKTVGPNTSNIITSGFSLILLLSITVFVQSSFQ